MFHFSRGIIVYCVLCVWALHLHNSGHLQVHLPHGIGGNAYGLISQTNLYKL